MNIQAVIEIYAGGIGSGPNAPCPQCGPHSFKEGDKVTLKRGTSVVHPKSGGKFKFDNDEQGTVVNMLPKVGNADQMVAVQLHHPPEDLGTGMPTYARANDLVLHTPATNISPWSSPSKMTTKGNLKPSFDKSGHIVAPDPHGITIKPVQKSQVIMHTTTNDGASLTWVKTPQTSEAEAKNLANEEHSLKGKFNLLTGVGVKDEDGQNRTTRVYDTTRTPLESRSVSRGSTVYVSSKTSGGKITGVNVREQNTGHYAQKISTASFSYKNAAAAIGMLKQRYGIVTSLKRLRGGA
jgi:hypothetical protein